MEHLEEQLEKHVLEDRENFKNIDGKLDKLLVDVAVVRGQWKLVGAILGTLAGIVGSWLFAG